MATAERKIESTDWDFAIAELKRELAVRERVYPEWIAKGRITKECADRRMQRLNLAIELLTLSFRKHFGMPPVQAELFGVSSL